MQLHHIARANFYRKTRFIDDKEYVETVHCHLSWIFDCPGCLYVYPFNLKEEALTARKVHMNRCCPAKLDQSFLEELFDDQFSAILGQLHEG